MFFLPCKYQTADSQRLWRGQEPQKTQSTGASVPESGLRELSDAFTGLFQAVKKEFEQLPNGMERLKQTLSLLILPLKIGGMVNLVPPTLYFEAKSIDEIFTRLSSFVNPLSFHLLRSLAQLCDCTSAAGKIAVFCHLRQTKSHLILCSEQSASPITPNGDNDLNTFALSGTKSVHAASYDHLQSFHPQVFAKPHDHTSPDFAVNFVRISAQLNKKVVTLSDYDATVTALSGFFLLPKSALVYVGCSSRPLTLCWHVLKELSIYMRQTLAHVNSELLLSEQGIANVMVEDWLDYTCLTSKVCHYIPSC